MNVVTQDDYEKVLAKAKERMGQMVDGLKISTMNSEVIKPKNPLEDIYFQQKWSHRLPAVSIYYGKGRKSASAVGISEDSRRDKKRRFSKGFG